MFVYRDMKSVVTKNALVELFSKVEEMFCVLNV